MTASNFFRNVADRTSELASQGVDKMKNVLGGLRGMTPEGVGNAAGRTVGDAGRATAEVASGAAKGFTAGLRGESVAGAPTPEASAYQADRAAQNARFAEAGAPKPQPTGLRAGLARVGRLAGPVGAAVAEGPSMVRNLTAGEDPIRTFGRSALRGGATLLGGALGAGAGTLVAPGPGTAAGGLAGGYAGYELGDKAADKLFGPEKSAGGAQAAPTKSLPDAPAPPSAPSSLRAPAQPDAEALIAGTGVPVPGTGAFKGGDRLAQNVGTPAPAGAPTSQAAQPVATGLRAPIAQPVPEGVFGEIAALHGLRSQDVAAQRRDVATREGLKLASETRGQDVTREGHQMQTALRLAELQKTLGNENEARVEKRNEDFARTKVAPPSGMSLPGANKDYEDAVKKKTSEVKEAIKYSLSDRKDGRTPAQLPEAEHSQLLLANDIKDRVVDARGNIFQGMRDFFGNKEFNSRNLYSYMPVKAVPGAMDGGYVIHFANGNTANIKEVGGGKFNILSSNTPVDSEVMALLKPFIDRAKAGR